MATHERNAQQPAGGSPAPLESFDNVMRRVSALVQAAQGARGSGAAMEKLQVAVGTLDPQALAKLRTLMFAGRDAQDLPGVHAALAQKPGPAAQVLDLFAGGVPSLEYLQKGHAIARATEFDLETGVDDWSATGTDRRSLDERVWLRFGRELAMSEPGAWYGLALLGNGKQLERLYLRRGESAWWSFDSVPDRPSAAVVERQQRALKRSKTVKLVPVRLSAVAEHRIRSGRRALRRAVLAIQARLGAFHALPAA